jgi:hypothetical protein
MKNIVLALFVLWFLSLHFYLYVPLVVSIALGAAFVSVASVSLLNWLYRRRSFEVNRADSLGL